MTTKSDKEAFLNIMSLISDYPKFVMIEKFLEGEELTVKSFTMDDSHLSSRAVYTNLRQWSHEGLLDVKVKSEHGRSYTYKLNIEKLMEKLS